jgi:tetratricopeptide (TPR) repeat protein
LAGWRNPLAIFGVLVLAGHLLEPSTPYTTPLAFLALGAGAASSVAVPVAGYLSTALVGASAWTVLAVGTWNLSAPGSTPASTMSRLRTARTLLHPWRQPYALSGQVSLRLTQLGVGDYSEQALSFFRAAANREPDDPSPWYDLGAQLQTMGFTAAARSAFMRGLAINPQSVVFRVALGNLDASTGDPADARTLFNQALVIQPGTPGAITGLASLNTVGPPG